MARKTKEDNDLCPRCGYHITRCRCYDPATGKLDTEKQKAKLNSNGN